MDNWVNRYSQMPHFLTNSQGKAGVRWDGQFDLLKSEQTSGGQVSRVRVTTEHYDRANDQIKAQGVDTSFWEANPVVLWGHDSGGWLGHSMPAIAQGANIQKVDLNGIGAIEADAIFHGLTPMSKQIGDLVNAKVIRTVSIGAIPLKWEDKQITQDDFANGRVYPGWSMERRIYLETEMIEFSFCNIPMNPFATVQNSFSAVDRGFEERLRDAIGRGVIGTEAEYVQHMMRQLGGERITLRNPMNGDTEGKLLSQQEMFALSVQRESREISAANIAELELIVKESGSAATRARTMIDRQKKEESHNGQRPGGKTMKQAEDPTTEVVDPATDAPAADEPATGATLDQVLAAVQKLETSIAAVDAKVQQLIDQQSTDEPTEPVADPAAESTTESKSWGTKAEIDKQLRSMGYTIPE